MTKNIRTIVRLDIKGGNVIKGIQFECLRVIGKPQQIAEDDLVDIKLEIAAGQAALDMDVDQAEAILRVEEGSKVEKMSSKELKRDMEVVLTANQSYNVGAAGTARTSSGLASSGLAASAGASVGSSSTGATSCSPRSVPLAAISV